MVKRKVREKAVPGEGVPVAVKIHVDPSPGTAVYYANYLEITHSQHDFVLSCVRVPGKFSSARQAELLKTKALNLEAEVQITLPPTLIRPLIIALEQQLTSYESTIGTIGVQKGAGDGQR